MLCYIYNYSDICSIAKELTLIEIFIVIVILTVLLATVLIAKSLIKNAKTLRVQQIMSSHQKAINIFYNLYEGYPGDVNVNALSGTPATNGVYRYQLGGTPNATSLSPINDGNVLGCDSRDGYRQLVLTGLLDVGSTYISTANYTTSPAQCALLTSTNANQSLSITTDIGISLPSIFKNKNDIGIYYGTVLSDVTSVNEDWTILGANLINGVIIYRN